MVFMTQRRRRIRRTGLALLAVIALTAGCASTDDPTAAGKTEVLAAFYPFAFVAERVGGPDVAVTNLTTPGVEPHDLELTPRQVGAISRTDLLIYLKGFQPAVDEAVAQEANHPLEVSTALPLEATPGSGTARDPHFWLDPTKLAAIVDPVADRLADADPAHAAAFRQRAGTLKEELADLDAEYRAGLANCAQTEFVTAHAAFGYLAERYGLRQVPIAGVSPEQEPAPARLQEIQQLVRTRGITTVFFESLLNPDLARTIARDTGATTAVLDPIEGIKDTAANDYLSVMRANLAALRKALSCP